MSTKTRIFGILVVAGVAAAVGRVTAAGAPDQKVTPTFTKDVLPILQKSCQTCHRPGTVAPMSLLTYEDARPWVRSVKNRVASRQMPPWHIDRSIGEYSNDFSLSDAQIDTIVRWVDGGAPKGDPKDAPPPVNFASLSEWSYGKPDLVVTCPETVVPAEGPDLYPAPVVDTNLPEDRWIKWMQVLPSAPKVVHHSVMYIMQDELSSGTDARGNLVDDNFNQNALDDPNAAGDDGKFRDRLTEYVIGNEGDLYDGDYGKLMQKDAKIVCSEHLHSYGEEAHSRSMLGIGFYPKGYVPKHKVVTKAVGHGTISVPPGEIARLDGYTPLLQPAKIISFQPHMHYRGSGMTLEAIYPDGHTRTLTEVPLGKYEVIWQTTYTYKEPILLPAGTMLHVISWHNNTSSNKYNPDPTGWVGAGSRTLDEMTNGWTDFIYITDEEYKQALAAEQAKSKAAKTDQQQQQ